MAKDYNVPMFIRYVDSLGNESTLEGVPEDINSRTIDWRLAGQCDLRPGDTLTAEVEVDATFPEEEYRVSSGVYGVIPTHGKKAVIPILLEHVGQQFEVIFEVRTNKDWHRQHGLDDRLAVLFRVLPPVSDQ